MKLKFLRSSLSKPYQDPYWKTVYTADNCEDQLSSDPIYAQWDGWLIIDSNYYESLLKKLFKLFFSTFLLKVLSLPSQ